MRITDFKLVFGNYAETFSGSVAREVRNGWQPRGEIFSTPRAAYNLQLVKIVVDKTPDSLI